MAIIGKKRSTQPSAGAKTAKKVKRDEPVEELHADPMIDPTDSSGSEMDNEDEDEDEDGSLGGEEASEMAEDDDAEVEEFDGADMADNGAAQPVADTTNDTEVPRDKRRSASAEAGPSSHPTRTHQKGKSLYAPATAEELDRLRSAQETGNTFTLQLEDLVARTLLPLAPHPGTKALLSKLHDLILGLPSLGGVSPKEAVKRLRGMGQGQGEDGGIPFVGGAEWSPISNETKGKGKGKGKGSVDKEAEVKWTLGWEKPAEVFVGGSWSVAGGYKKGKGVAGDVDLVVVMPPSLFSPKDRLDYRYFHKRSHYLAVIKAAITQAFHQDASLRDMAIEWEYPMDDARRPIIVLRAGKAQGLKYATDIKIHASMPADVFVAAHLSPAKSLLRIASASASAAAGAGADTGAEAENAESTIPPPSATPLYASSITQDLLPKSHLLHLHRLSTSLADRNLASFLALWRLWASQRSIPVSRGASGWFAGMLLGWIVNGGRIGGQGGVRERTKEVAGLGKGLGYWGCLRAAWEFLARTDFEATPVFVGHGDENPIAKEHFMQEFKDVMVDPSGMVNVFAGWEKGDVQLLRHHARETLAMLEDHSVDRFGEVFSKGKSGQIGVFDEVIVADISDAQLSETTHQLAEQPARGLRIAHAIAQTLRQGLSDRASLVHVSPLPSASITPPSHSSSLATTCRVQIGIIYNPSQATRVLDVGPSSDQTTACEAFRALWGDKADLRRFKDGSIAESVVWPIARPEDAALIPVHIVRWLLLRHFSIAAPQVSARYSGDEWLGITQVPASAREATCVQGAEKQGFAPINKAYEELYKLLKSVDTELPLAILNVVPADESLRHSSTFIPHPIDAARSALAPDCLRYVPSAEVILQFESSPRWPDDLSAIQKVKLAIFEKLARVIMESKRPGVAGARAEVVFDHTVVATQTDIEDQAALEVLMPNGIAFRLRIHHEKERTHLERIIDGDAPAFGTSLPLPPRRLAIPALAHYTTRFVHRPAHHAAVQPLHSRFPTYSSATRLLKRWIACHMLSLHVPSEAVELIMASVYLDSGSTAPPSSAGAGFARALERLAGWAYDETALVVPLISATHDASYAKGASEEEILKSQSGRARFPLGMRKEAEAMFAQRHQQLQVHAAGNDNGVNGSAVKGRGKPHAVAEGKGAWTIVTEQDLEGRRWTRTMPSRVVAGRVRQLAGAAHAVMTSGQELLSVKSLFKTPLADYDILIHLRPALLPRYAQSLSPVPATWESRLRTQFRNVPSSSTSSAYGPDVRVGFDPAATFARDLQRLYGDGMVVFHDELGGDVIGLLFNPGNQGRRAFKPFLGYNTKPVGNDSDDARTGGKQGKGKQEDRSELVEVNREAVLAEIARIGEGLIERMERGSAFA